MSYRYNNMDESQTNHTGGFPGGPVIKTLPANAGGAGLIPGLRRSHLPWRN